MDVRYLIQEFFFAGQDGSTFVGATNDMYNAIIIVRALRVAHPDRVYDFCKVVKDVDQFYDWYPCTEFDDDDGFVADCHNFSEFVQKLRIHRETITGGSS